MYPTVCPTRGTGTVPRCGRVFRGIFPWLITLCQPVLSQCGGKWLNLPSLAPHSLWTSKRKANYGHAMAEIKKGSAVIKVIQLSSPIQLKIALNRLSGLMHPGSPSAHAESNFGFELFTIIHLYIYSFNPHSFSDILLCP